MTTPENRRGRFRDWFLHTFMHPDDRHMWGMTLPLTIVVCLLGYTIRALT